MEFGVIFPQTEFGTDPADVRAYAEAAEAAGLDHIDAYDHILGANPERPGGWRGPYTYKSCFLEPFVLFSYMAAFTRRVKLATNIIILPQRQTALVAKQAATLDVLSGGRVRLGVGLGWNPVEYEALNENFRNRGRRIEEQVQVMRELWTKELVTFKGRWHTISDAGLNPLPVQRPIPVWFGGRAEEVIARIARMADGWMMNFRHAEEARPAVALLHAALQKEGRDAESFPIEARVLYGDGRPEGWQAQVEQWRELGVSHVSLNAFGGGLDSAAAHIDAVRRFGEATRGWR